VAEIFNSKPEASGLIVSPLEKNEIHMFEPVVLSTEETRKMIIFNPLTTHQMWPLDDLFFDPIKNCYKKTVADCISSPISGVKHIIFFYLVGWDLTPIRSLCRSPRFV
jgi:hypothetical protein